MIGRLTENKAVCQKYFPIESFLFGSGDGALF